MSKNTKLIFLGLTLLTIPFFSRATVLDFNVDSSYDYQGRTKVSAAFLQAGQAAYFYIEDDYYQNLNEEERKKITEEVQNLSKEFDEKIYIELRAAFGFEWKPGIDKDDKITILLTQIKEDSAGYFNSGDEYPKAQIPASNEREMIYLNVDYLGTPLMKSYLAHEFSHLIQFNQKERILGQTEETWLQETRAEAGIAVLGYDSDYENSNLQRRVKAFLQKPEDSLTEWKNVNFDYGVANLFSQYLLDHYKAKIFEDSLYLKTVGIPSLEEALKLNGSKESFSEIFSNWLITLLVNDCGLGPKYCYLNQNLKNLRIMPQMIYLTLSGESVLTSVNYSKTWAGNWFKFVGGKGTLKLEFIGEQRNDFKVPYLTQDFSGKYFLNFLALDSSQRGMIFIPDFGSQYSSLTIIPSLGGKRAGFDGLEPYHKFIWTAAISQVGQNQQEQEQELIKTLLGQIEILKAEIAKVQSQIAAIKKIGTGTISCQKLENNLYYGMINNSEVRCLQEFLKKQGQDIYPERQVTGNFLTKTRLAVIRFQEKYASEILAPSGLNKGTGFVGQKTRIKINQLLGFSQ